MVVRTEASGKLEMFEAIVESIEIESSLNDRKQFHIVMAPTNVEVKGTTGKLHEWVPMSSKATETEVPQGSVLDRYLQQVEIVIPAAKKESTVSGAMNLLKGKKFRFQKVKLGKDFDGHPAREYAVPVVAL